MRQSFHILIKYLVGRLNLNGNVKELRAPRENIEGSNNLYLGMLLVYSWYLKFKGMSGGLILVKLVGDLGVEEYA